MNWNGYAEEQRKSPISRYAEHLATTTFSELPANDNAPLIGLTGLRNVGKTTVTDLLEEEFGFTRIHAFDGGKAASVAYFEHLTGSHGAAYAMVYGELKDKPSPYLPGGVSPRFFLEKFGNFMGATMGVEWTLGMEVKRAREQAPNTPIVVESLVYEAGWFRENGGTIVRIERPDFKGPRGLESDSVQAEIVADVTLSATSVDTLLKKARALARDGWRVAA